MAQSKFNNPIPNGQFPANTNLPSRHSFESLSKILSQSTLIDANATATAPAGSLLSPPSSHSEIKGHAKSPVRSASPTNASSQGGLPAEQLSEGHVPGLEWDMTRVEKVKGFITRWFAEWWLLEIISWGFSALCMALILTVLLHFNGRPLPHLGFLTLNSLISILSGFAKASLLLPTAEALGQLKWVWFRKPKKMADFEIIDSASRGPWGSIVLLANTKGM